MLPGTNGNEACPEIEESGKFNSIIVVSMIKIGAVDAGQEKEPGADNYIVRTTDYEELISWNKKLIDTNRSISKSASFFDKTLSNIRLYPSFATIYYSFKSNGTVF